MAPGGCGSNFWTLFMFINTSCEIALRWLPQNTYDDKSNIGSGNGLVPSSNKPLPLPVLTQIYCRHKVTMSYLRLEYG